jgi:hypothetical protein
MGSITSLSEVEEEDFLRGRSAPFLEERGLLEK